MSDSAVPAACDEPPENRGHALLDVAEDQWFDRKSIRTAPTKLAEDLVAFANAEGGTLAIGLSQGAVEGVDRDPRRANALQQAAIDHTEPPVPVETRFVDCQRDDGTADRLLLIDIPPSETLHATNRDEVYLRVGDETRRLGFRERRELLYDKGQAHFESTPVTNIDLGELDQELLNDFAARLRTTRIEHTLKSLGLLSRHNEVTAACYLLFAPTPQDEFTEAYVRILRYTGTERGTGVRQGLSHDVRCTGPLAEMIETSREQIRDLQPAHRALNSQSGRFERRGLIPEDAWLEGLVNAVIHRSYSIGGDHIRVDIFDDRMEIHSPGRFPGLTRAPTEDPRDIIRFARNPRIAKACSVLGYGQELGEGIRRIFEEMRIAGLGDPLYRETTQSVHLTLDAVQVDRQAMEGMPPTAREVMLALRQAGGLSTGDLADLIGRSRPMTIRLLRQMRSAGLIDWVGNSPRDPRAYWRIHSE
jgi:ATP-dependent DNA helicase RecG